VPPSNPIQCDAAREGKGKMGNRRTGRWLLAVLDQPWVWWGSYLYKVRGKKKTPPSSLVLQHRYLLVRISHLHLLEPYLLNQRKRKAERKKTLHSHVPT